MGIQPSGTVGTYDPFYPDFGNTANYRYTTHSIQIFTTLPITGKRPILILSRFWQHCQLQVNDPFYFYPDFGNTANYRYTTHSIQILAALPITGVRPILLRYWQHCQLQVYCTTHSTQFGNTANYRYKTHSTQISSILPITGIRPILYPSWPHWFLTRAGVQNCWYVATV